MEEQRPLVASVREVGTACANCLRVADDEAERVQLEVCSACRTAGYCSVECRLADAGLHSLECPLAQRTPGAPARVRLAARFVWWTEAPTEQPRDKWLAEFLAETLRQADTCLSSHRLSAEDRLELDEEAREVLAFMGRGSEVAAGELDTIRRAVLIMQMWAVAVGSRRGVYASAWFPRASLLNHSCQPNCALNFLPTGGLEVRTIREVSAGDPLHISYIDGAQALAYRREDLRNFYFECSCQRCTSAEHALLDLELRGLRCPDDTCRFAIPPESSDLRCATCGEALPATHFELAHLLKQGVQLHMQGHRLYRRERTGEAAACLRRCLSIRTTLLHACNADLLATLDVAYKALIAERDWPAARRCLVQLIAARRQLAPICGYQRGRDPFDVVLLLADLARVVAQQQDASAARAYSEEVRDGLTFVLGAPSSTANVIMRGLIEDIK